MQEGGECWCPRLDGGGLGRRPRHLLFCALVCSGNSRPFSPCVAVVSGSDVVQGGIFFSLNLKGFILERGTDCTFSTGGSFLVVNTKIQYIL